MGLSLQALLPVDWREAQLMGRVDCGHGPTPVLLAGGSVYDLTPSAATMASAIEKRSTNAAAGTLICTLDVDAPALPDGWKLLPPIDLQCIKAAGVTFAVSAIERVIEESARGDANRAADIRGRLETRVGAGIRSVVPGSAEAAALKQVLIDEGLWSQYLEVAIGPDAEIFTKSPILSSVGAGAMVGVRSDSSWNNPEPEVVLVADSHGNAVGAMLGNDVNLRDFEGRSALLLGKAKDNSASCALGPFIRLFDDGFTIDDVRSATVDLTITGPDGYILEGSSRMSEISRDPLDLLAQAMSEHHYPDGYVLFLGTLFAPTKDRDVPGGGFTHKVGDIVSIRSPRLGMLENEVTTSRDAPAWTIGVAALMRNLGQRGLIDKL